MIRLAHYQGLLSQPEPNRYQNWAGQYWLRMQRRIELRDTEDTLQRQTWYLFPDRYEQLFLEGHIGDPIDPMHDEEPFEQPVTNLDDIDSYFDSLEEKRSISGGQVFALIDDDGQGVWV